MEAIKWRTYDGRELYIHDMTHDHVSSLYYFIRYISTRQHAAVKEEIDRVINEKFHGVILPYRPPCDVIGEAEILQEKGMLKYDKEHHKYNIHNEDGEWIGKIILKPELEVDEETGKFKVDRLLAYKTKRKTEFMSLLAAQVEQDNMVDLNGFDDFKNSLLGTSNDLINNETAEDLEDL